MLDTILQAFLEKVKTKVAELEQELLATYNFMAFEKALTALMNDFSATLSQWLLQDFLSNPLVLVALKQVAARRGMRFKEYRSLNLRLINGQTITVSSPYFIKAPSKRGSKKRGPNGRGAHLGLGILGFVGYGSPSFVSEVVKMAVLCPSFEVVKAVMAERGIAIDVKTVRRLCQDLGKAGMVFRGGISLSGTEKLAGYTLVIGIDGGRLRERRKKRRPKKEGQKRRGYHTDWREPKLFTIYLLNEQGEKVKEFAPLHDATMGGHKAMFELLTRYLDALDLREVQRVVFCGDGAAWIWGGVEELVTKLGVTSEQIYQVVDYTHAMQNLQEIIELVPAKAQKQTKGWAELLWQGDMAGLKQGIGEVLTGKKQEQALKKWQNYFARHEKRMSYEQFKANHLPCGSGAVESAIRRVINLRLKAAGTFWTREMAECFLWLRSQLVSGRWHIVMKNIWRKSVQKMLDLRQPATVKIT